MHIDGIEEGLYYTVDYIEERTGLSARDFARRARERSIEFVLEGGAMRVPGSEVHRVLAELDREAYRQEGEERRDSRRAELAPVLEELSELNPDLDLDSDDALEMAEAMSDPRGEDEKATAEYCEYLSDLADEEEAG